jgi:hypothetical protein
MVGGREKCERVALRVLWTVLSLPVIYLLSAAVVFDFTTTAWDFCQEYDEDRRLVAHGPYPSVRLCRPRSYDIPGGASWSGTEWAFSVYRPVCVLWLKMKGYGRAHRCSE